MTRVHRCPQAEREALLLPELAALTEQHRARLRAPTRRILDAIGLAPAPYARVADLPWLPVRLFKTHELRSVPEDEVFKVLTSSGTTGQVPSRIYLDQAGGGRADRACWPRRCARCSASGGCRC